MNALVTALVIVVSVPVLASCAVEKPRDDPPPSVYRICRDGTHIFQYADGTFRTPWGYRVTNPDEVCGQ